MLEYLGSQLHLLGTHQLSIHNRWFCGYNFHFFGGRGREVCLLSLMASAFVFQTIPTMNTWDTVSLHLCWSLVWIILLF